MENQPNQHDGAIDKTLSALSHAAPPTGMEARIAARIAQRAEDNASAPETAFGWRSLFAGSSLTGAWWRGALTGAAAAMLSVCAVLFASHGVQSQRAQTSANNAARESRPSAIPVSAPRPNATSSPCASPKAMHVRAGTMPRSEAPTTVNSPSHPAPVRPLTAQERALAELARTADPKLLVALAPETQARVEAQEEENFKKFFAPPPPPPPPVDSEPTTKPNPNQSLL